jgi:hypothetical protein
VKAAIFKEDAPPSFWRVAFIDLEASGLGSNGFPTELGWAVIRQDGSIESDSCLIRPPPKWTFYANAWSYASEHLTGITREMLEQDGLPPGEAMKRFLAAVGERQLFSDEPDFDAHWLAMLAKAAGVSIEGREIGHIKRLIEKICPNLRPGLEVDGPRHRAEPDAKRLALAFAAIRDVA